MGVRVLFLKTWGDEVGAPTTRDRREELAGSLLCLEPRGKSFSPDQTEALGQLAHRVYRIGAVKLEQDPYGMVANLADDIRTMIREEKVEQFHEAARIYVMFAQTYLKLLDSVGVAYTRERAAEERRSLGGGWQTVRWLTKHLSALIELAFRCQDPDIVRYASYLPFAFCREAIRFGDHYLFGEAIRLHSVTCYRTLKLVTSELRDLMADRVVRYVNELVSFTLVPAIKDSQDEERTENVGEFIFQLVEAANRWLRIAYCEEDRDLFASLVSLVRGIEEELQSALTRQNSRHARSVLTRGGLPDLAKAQWEKRLREAEYLEQLQRRVSRERKVALFGFAAYALDHMAPADGEHGLAKEAVHLLEDALPSDLQSLCSVFFAALERETQDLYDWGWWDLRADGKAHFTGFRDKLAAFFVYASLRALAGLAEEQFETFQLPVERNWTYLYSPQEGQGAVYQALKEARIDTGKWATMLNEEERSNTAILEALIQDAVKAYAGQVEQRIMDSPLVDEKVERYQKNVLDGVEEASFLRSLFGEFDAIVEQTDGNEIPSRWGTNTVETKEQFIDEPQMHLGRDWGKTMGHGLGTQEDRLLFEEMASECHTTDITKENTADAVAEAVCWLSEHGEEPNVIIVTNAAYLDWELHGDPLLTPFWADDCQCKSDLPGFEGEYMPAGTDLRIPVYALRLPNERSTILVANIPHFGALVQYPPYDNATEKEDVIGRFVMRIIDLNANSDERQRFLDSPPQWLTEKDNRETYLRGRVLINIWERFEFEVRNRKAAVHVETLHEENNTEK